MVSGLGGWAAAGGEERRAVLKFKVLEFRVLKFDGRAHCAGSSRKSRVAARRAEFGGGERAEGIGRELLVRARAAYFELRTPNGELGTANSKLRAPPAQQVGGGAALSSRPRPSSAARAGRLIRSSEADARGAQSATRASEREREIKTEAAAEREPSQAKSANEASCRHLLRSSRLSELARARTSSLPAPVARAPLGPAPR